MPNTLITPSIIAKEALMQLENNLILGDKVHREYKKEFRKVGDTISIRRPVKFVVSNGATRVNQDVGESNASLTLANRRHVSWSFSTQDLSLTIEEYSERYIKPAMIVMANDIDLSIAQAGAAQFFRHSGTAGTTPATFAALTDAARRMDDAAIPDDGMRQLVLNPTARWGLANGLGIGTGGVFNADINGKMIRKGMLGQLAQFDIYGDQNIALHQWGAGGGTPAMNGATANAAAALVIDGASNSIANWARVGDIIEIAGVNEVNPVSKQDTGNPMQFLVTAAATSDGAGNVTLAISPALNDGSTSSTAAYQNVTALPADGALVTFAGGLGTAPAGVSHPQNLAFHKNALALVTCDLELPDSAAFKARANWRGYSIRVVKDYDIDADEEIIRLDTLYGVSAIYPDLGMRVTG